MERKGYTRFEKARILGARSLQIATGAPPLLRSRGHSIDPMAIAAEEVEAGIFPIILRRNTDDVD